MDRNHGRHCAVVPLRGPLRVDQRDRRRHLGHLVAPLDRPRHVLDAGAPGDLSRRHRRRPHLRLGRAADDVRAAIAEAERGATVRFWGFRAPLGAWVCIWGAFAMVTSAPFDDWWHNAYGLDVKILSPPHMLLAAGIAAIQCGAMLMALAWQNRAAGDRRAARPSVSARRRTAAGPARRHRRDRIHRSAGTCTSRSSIRCRPACSCFFLVSTARASIARWPATMTALVYTGLTLLMLLLLPLFRGAAAARADLRAGRSLHAAGLSAAARRAGARDRSRDAARRPRPRLAAVAPPSASSSSPSFLAVQWPFADFLMTPWARNWFFVSDRMQYGVDPAMQARWYTLNPPDNLAVGLPIAVVLGVRLGALRPVVGQLDVASAAMIDRPQPRSPAGELGAAARARARARGVDPMAHVGSPDTFFVGKAGPYHVRVIVRLPGVIPGPRASVASASRTKHPRTASSTSRSARASGTSASRARRRRNRRRRSPAIRRSTPPSCGS